MDKILHDLNIEPIAAREWDDDPNGRLLVWEPPRKNCRYVAGVDVGTGQGLTNSVIHVMRVGSMFDPDTQVAEFACNFLDPHELSAVCNLVGRWYWDWEYDLPALMCIECNNVGESTQYDLQTVYGYTNFYIWKIYDRATGIYSNKLGWWTTPRSRKKIVLWGEHMLRTQQWIINSPWFIDEMADFELPSALGNSVIDNETLAAARHAPGALDDRLMAGFIAAWCGNDLRPDGRDPAIERQRWQDAQQRQEERVEKFGVRADFQNTPVSYSKMIELGDL